MNTFARGVRLGDFEIVRELGRGSMGVVYEATQRPLERRVALKVLPISVQRKKSSALARFHTEAKAVGRLSHPNIVQIYASGEAQGICYYAMEYIEGEDLKSAIATQPLTAEKLARIGRDVALALHAAHEHGIVHRDIKPANILLEAGGRARVTDFGLAKVADDPKITMAGHVVGSPAYMSPEQATGNSADIDARSDLFCLGITLYQAGSRAMPFTGHNLEELFENICLNDPPALRKLNRRLPADLVTIIETCLRKRPERRYTSAQALADDFDAFLNNRPITARPPRLHEKLGAFVSRNRLLSVTLTVLFLLVVLGGSVRVLWNLRTEREVGSLMAQLEAHQAAQASDEALATCRAILTLDPGNRAALKLEGRLEADLERQRRQEMQQRLAGEAAKPIERGRASLQQALRLEVDLDAIAEALRQEYSRAARELGASLASVQTARSRELEAMHGSLEEQLLAASEAADNHFSRAFALVGSQRLLLEDMGRVRILLAEHAERRGRHDVAGRLLREVTFLYNPDGVHDRLLEPSGALVLRTDRPAQASLIPLSEDPRGIAMVALQAVLEGPTPLGPVQLNPGSYRLELRFVGGSLSVPLAIRRGQRLELDLRLLKAEQIPPGFVYVPAMPALLGGDAEAGHGLPPIAVDAPGFLMAELEVSLAEFCRFLAGSSDAQGFNLTRSLRDSIVAWAPSTDAIGRRPAWDIAWFWARKYCDWLNSQQIYPQPVRLPTELEWELAARGTDGRWFPWGNGLDPSENRADLGLQRGAPGLPADPADHPEDRSPFAVLNLTGGVSEWTQSCHAKNPQLAVLRGGSFLFQTELPRSARRRFHSTDVPVAGAGIRLVMDLPP